MDRLKIRPFDPDDFGLLLDLANLAVPFDPQGNQEWLKFRKDFDESRYQRRHFLAEVSGQAVGYGALEQQGETPTILRLFVVCSPENMSGEVGEAVYARLLLEARALGATVLWAREYLQDESVRDFLLSRGFEEVDRFRLPDKLPMVVYRTLLE